MYGLISVDIVTTNNTHLADGEVYVVPSIGETIKIMNTDLLIVDIIWEFDKAFKHGGKITIVVGEKANAKRN